MTADMALPVVVFTETHAAALLATLTALDPRLRAPDDQTGRLRIGAWSKLLGEVDPGYAMRFCERVYSEPRDWPLQPGEILQAWRQDQHEARVAEEVRAAQRDGVTRGPDPRMLAYVRAVVDALTAGRSMESVPRPEGVRGALLTGEQEARERRCTYWRMCACDHRKCYDGFADATGVRVGVFGRRYEEVTRCLSCKDALLMAEEQGVAKKPSHLKVQRRSR